MATRAELAALKNTSGFTDRVTMCIVFYAKFITGEDPATVNHQRRFSWATAAILNPVGVAGQIAPLVAIDATFANQASPVTDWNPILAGLPETGAGSVQTATETAINSSVIVY